MEKIITVALPANVHTALTEYKAKNSEEHCANHYTATCDGNVH
jgi:hypothetical protein